MWPRWRDSVIPPRVTSTRGSGAGISLLFSDGCLETCIVVRKNLVSYRIGFGSIMLTRRVRYWLFVGTCPKTKRQKVCPSAVRFSQEFVASPWPFVWSAGRHSSAPLVLLFAFQNA